MPFKSTIELIFFTALGWWALLILGLVFNWWLHWLDDEKFNGRNPVISVALKILGYSRDPRGRSFIVCKDGKFFDSEPVYFALIILVPIIIPVLGSLSFYNPVVPILAMIFYLISITIRGVKRLQKKLTRHIEVDHGTS